jgi:hypothetical protein
LDPPQETLPVLTLAEMTDHNAYLFKRLAYQRLSRATAAIADTLHDWDTFVAVYYEDNCPGTAEQCRC